MKYLFKNYLRINCTSQCALTCMCTYRWVDFIQFFIFSDGVIDFLLHIGDVLFVCDVTGSFSQYLDSSWTG